MRVSAPSQSAYPQISATVARSSSSPLPVTAENAISRPKIPGSGRSEMSDLFESRTVTSCFPAELIYPAIRFSSSVISPSTTKRMSDARSVSAKARSTPMRSTVSAVSRIPAVSDRFSTTSPSTTLSVITSRVVPSMSVTMARSLPQSRLSRLDFPVFGLPMIAAGTPSLMARP